MSVGLPLSVILVLAIFLNFFSGWNSRATMALQREQSSLILVLIAAALLIVCFMVIFSSRHRWDMNEQHYKELKARQENA